jgi:hypothetical protein
MNKSGLIIIESSASRLLLVMYTNEFTAIRLEFHQYYKIVKLLFK